MRVLAGGKQAIEQPEGPANIKPFHCPCKRHQDGPGGKKGRKIKLRTKKKELHSFAVRSERNS